MCGPAPHAGHGCAGPGASGCKGSCLSRLLARRIETLARDPNAGAAGTGAPCPSKPEE